MDYITKHSLKFESFPVRCFPLVSLFSEEAGIGGSDPCEKEVMYDGDKLWVSFYSDLEYSQCNELVVQFSEKLITVFRVNFIHDEKTSSYMDRLIRCLESISPDIPIVFENIYTEEQKRFCFANGYLEDPINEGRMLPMGMYWETYGEMSYEDHFLLALLNRYLGWRQCGCLIKKTWRLYGMLKEYKREFRHDT